MTSPKYPRTPHFPFSPGATNDDRVQPDISALIGRPILLLEKLDGSNCSLEKSGVFARSHNSSPSHASFSMAKALHAEIGYRLPDDVQVFGENVYAVHSIEYSELQSHFLVFGARDLNHDDPQWYDWDLVETMAHHLGLHTVPVLERGTFQSEEELEKRIRFHSAQPSKCGGEMEGVVVRVADGFSDSTFDKSVVKYVRANHVKTSNHWAHQTIRKNGLEAK